MKKQLFSILLGVVTSSVASADLKGWAIDTSVPCLAAMIAGPVLFEKNGIQTGMVVCSGVAAYTTLKHYNGTQSGVGASNEDLARLEKLVKSMEVKQNALAKKVTSGKGEDLTDDVKREVEDMVNTEVMRLSQDSYERMKRMISSPDYMPELVDRVNSRIRTEVLSELDAQRSALIREIAEEVVLQVTARPIIIKGQRVILPEATEKAPRRKNEEIYPRPTKVNPEPIQAAPAGKKRPKVFLDEE